LLELVVLTANDDLELLSVVLAKVPVRKLSKSDGKAVQNVLLWEICCSFGTSHHSSEIFCLVRCH